MWVLLAATARKAGRHQPSHPGLLQGKHHVHSWAQGRWHTQLYTHHHKAHQKPKCVAAGAGGAHPAAGTKVWMCMCVRVYVCVCACACVCMCVCRNCGISVNGMHDGQCWGCSGVGVIEWRCVSVPPRIREGWTLLLCCAKAYECVGSWWTFRVHYIGVSQMRLPSCFLFGSIVLWVYWCCVVWFDWYTTFGSQNSSLVAQHLQYRMAWLTLCLGCWNSHFCRLLPSMG